MKTILITIAMFIGMMGMAQDYGKVRVKNEWQIERDKAIQQASDLKWKNNTGSVPDAFDWQDKEVESPFTPSPGGAVNTTTVVNYPCNTTLDLDNNSVTMTKSVTMYNVSSTNGVTTGYITIIK